MEEHLPLDDRQRKLIRVFLIEFKRIATEGRGIDFVPRPDNLDALSELGLTFGNARDEIMALSVTDYCDGPEDDRDKPGDIWVFGQEIEGKEVYITLKVASVGDEKLAKCISFHISRRPLRFPYRSPNGRSKK